MGNQLTDAILIAESCLHPLEILRIQIPSAPDGTAIGLKLLRDLLQNLDSHIRIKVTVRPGADLDTMNSLIERWQCDSGRVDFIEAQVGSLFAQDNAMTMHRQDGYHYLLLPKKDNRIGISKRIKKKRLERAYGLTFRRSKLYWDGGNICYDGNHCLIGSNTIALNMKRKKQAQEQVVQQFEEEFGSKVTVLGNIEESKQCLKSDDPNHPFLLEGGQADFHLDLDLCLLGEVRAGHPPLVAIADTEINFELLNDIVDQSSLFDQHFLPAEEMKAIYLANLGATMRRRKPYISAYRLQLEELGYQCITVPDFRLHPDLNYLGRLNFTFNYINVIPCASARSGPTCYYAGYGLEGIEKEVERVYGEAGIKARLVNPVASSTGNELMHLRGGLHCATSKLG